MIIDRRSAVFVHAVVSCYVGMTHERNRLAICNIYTYCFSAECDITDRRSGRPSTVFVIFVSFISLLLLICMQRWTFVNVADANLLLTSIEYWIVIFYDDVIDGSTMIMFTEYVFMFMFNQFTYSFLCVLISDHFQMKRIKILMIKSMSMHNSLNLALSPLFILSTVAYIRDPGENCEYKTIFRTNEYKSSDLGKVTRFVLSQFDSRNHMHARDSIWLLCWSWFKIRLCTNKTPTMMKSVSQMNAVAY